MILCVNQAANSDLIFDVGTTILASMFIHVHLVCVHVHGCFFLYDTIVKFCTEDDWLSEPNCKMIKKCVSVECCSDPSVLDFKKKYRKKLFKGVKITAPNYCLDEHGTLYHILRVRNVEQKREVVSDKRNS